MTVVVEVFKVVSWIGLFEMVWLFLDNSELSQTSHFYQDMVYTVVQWLKHDK